MGNDIRPVRYQHAAWYVRVWRWRHLLAVPARAVRLYRRGKYTNRAPLSWVNAWSLAKGIAHIHMHWYYTWDELSRDLLKDLRIEQ